MRRIATKNYVQASRRQIPPTSPLRHDDRSPPLDLSLLENNAQLHAAQYAGKFAADAPDFSCVTRARRNASAGFPIGNALNAPCDGGASLAATG
jgi:hypothetical protein